MPVIVGLTGSTALKQESFCHGNHRLLTQFTMLSTKVKKKPCEHDPETLPSSLGLSSSKTKWKTDLRSDELEFQILFGKLWRRDLVHLVDNPQSKSISDGMAAYIFRKTLVAPRIQYQTRLGHHSTPKGSAASLLSH